MSTPSASEGRTAAPVPAPGDAPTARHQQVGDGVNRYLTWIMLGTLAVLFVEILLESWIQELLGHRWVDDLGVLVGPVPGWPKTLKNGLLLALVVVSAVKITVERRWRSFATRADLAVAVLALIMVLAGLLGTSGSVLIGQAVFVYLRGAIVFYAIRALHPAWDQVKRLLWVVGPILALDVLVAVVQMAVGQPAYSGLGWVDMQWAQTHRAMGLLDHPNQLGHVLGLVLIGLVAWLSGMPRANRWWWLAVGAAAVGLAGTQSRESMAATLAAAALIWFLRRAGGRHVLVVGVVVVVAFAGYLVARPSNLNELLNRVGGVTQAVGTPAGNEDCTGYASNKDCVDAGKVEKREIRLLFFQQGARLLVGRPMLGYGVGQFGGTVAEQNDPHWELDPRFPGGFDLYDFDGTTVDSFWLHLVVETGMLGLLAYLAWLWLITVPLLGATQRFTGRRMWGASRATGPAQDVSQTLALWGIGVMLFTVVIGVMSPALEDALYPPLAFAIFGLAWVFAVPDGTRAVTVPAPEARLTPAGL